MAAWTWGDILSQSKEWVLVAIGEKALTAQKEAEIRKETESAIRRAGGGASEIAQANAEITSVIQMNQREQVRAVEAPKKLLDYVIDTVTGPVSKGLGALLNWKVIVVVIAVAAIFGFIKFKRG